MPPVSRLRLLPLPLQVRYAERFLRENQVPEPEQAHISGVLNLIASPKPSARLDFPGGIVIARDYEHLVRLRQRPIPEAVMLPMPGSVTLPQWGIQLTVSTVPNGGTGVRTQGALWVRSRKEGDSLRRGGGTKSLKKQMIDRKISAAQRPFVPILADEAGVIWAGSFGFHLDRLEGAPTCYILIEELHSDKNPGGRERNG